MILKANKNKWYLHPFLSRLGSKIKKEFLSLFRHAGVVIYRGIKIESLWTGVFFLRKIQLLNILLKTRLPVGFNPQ